jgi:hypothetical protein
VCRFFEYVNGATPPGVVVREFGGVRSITPLALEHAGWRAWLDQILAFRIVVAGVNAAHDGAAFRVNTRILHAAKPPFTATPSLEDARAWLETQQRLEDIRKCDRCGSWFLAVNRRAARCPNARCKGRGPADNANYMRQYRQTPAVKRRVTSKTPATKSKSHG